MKVCLYDKCRQEFEPKKPKAVFCSAKCRVYFNRKKNKGGETEPAKKQKLIPAAAPTNTGNVPLRQNFESGIDYKIALSEWEQKKVNGNNF